MYLTPLEKPLPRLSALQAAALFLSTLLLVAAVAGAFVILFAYPDEHNTILVHALYAFLLCYLVREGIYFVCSPPRYRYLGWGLVRWFLRLLVFLIRCVVRVAQAAAYTALCILALGPCTSPETLLAGLTLGFVAISVVQESEWSGLLIRRGAESRPLPVALPVLGYVRERQPRMRFYMREVFCEIDDEEDRE